MPQYGTLQRQTDVQCPLASRQLYWANLSQGHTPTCLMHLVATQICGLLQLGVPKTQQDYKTTGQPNLPVESVSL